jgi:glycosyltransferase involved in cell wall biosynthesis
VKIAYVLGTATGGTGAHVAMLARECAARGNEVTVYAPAETAGRFFAGPAGQAGGAAAPGRTARAAGPAGPAGPLSAAAPVPAGGPAPAVRAAATADETAMTTAPAGEEGTPPGPAGDGGSVAAVRLDIADRPRPARDLSAVRRLRGLLRRSAPDVVHAHGLRAGAVTALALGRRRPGRRPLVVTVHNAPPAGGAAGAVYLLLERIVARRADAVTWVSRDLAERMRRCGARDGGRALVPAPPADPPSAAQRALARDSLAAEGPVVLAVGRLTSQKGFGVLLRAAAGWQDRRPVPLVVIAGDGPLGPALAAQARAQGLTVRFLGQRGDVPALLAAADVVVVPSHWEGQPLIVQEALRAGAPLVASRAGGIPDLTGEDGAVLVAPGDPGALAVAVRSLLDDPGRAAGLAAAAARRATSLPTVSAAADAAVGLYGRLA